jgi:NADPH:quinone reductase
MNAVVLERPGGALVLRRMDRPRPGRGQVLIRVAAAPINPSDLGFLAGTYGSGPALPAIPGFEGSGTVVEAGAGPLPWLLKGRRVAFASSSAGSWAEYAVVPAASCIPVGSAVSFEQAATLVVNPLTALAFFDMVRRGRHAAIVSDAAASALGRMILRLGRSRSVPVINVVRRQEQLGELLSLGATHVLLDSEEGFPERLRDLARQLNATLVLDAVGGRRTGALVDAAPPGSTIVAYALLSGEPSAFNSRRLIVDRKRIEGFYLGHWIARRPLWARVGDVLSLRRLGATELRTHVQERVPLEAVAEAVDLYKSRMTAGKVLLIADGEASNHGRVATQKRQTESITGTSTSTPTTVARAAPEPGP